MLVSVRHLLLLDGPETPLGIGNELVQLCHIFSQLLLRLRVVKSLLAECTEANLVLRVVEARACLGGRVVIGAVGLVDGGVAQVLLGTFTTT